MSYPSTVSFSRYRMRLMLLASVVVALLPAGDATGQMLHIETPFHSVGNSFYERHGVNFGFSIPGGRGPGSRIVGLNPQGQFTPNIGFSQGGAGAAVPPFGGYDPNASARLGFSRFGSDGGGFSLGFEFGKGSSRSISSAAPSLTVQNGFGGSIQSGSFRPFVTGLVPVAGNSRFVPVPQGPSNGVTRALQSGQLDLNNPRPKSKVAPDPRPAPHRSNSSAQRGDIGVAAIKAQKAAERVARQARIEALSAEADAMQKAGKFREARTRLRELIQLVEDESLKRQLKARLREIRGAN